MTNAVYKPFVLSAPMSDSSLSPMSKDGMSPNSFYSNNRIDKEKNLYPHSIVWTPIPLLTCVIFAF